MPVTITDVVTHDIRFPTSADARRLGCDERSPDYSAAYVVLRTDHPDGLEGHGLTFTTGRGNELCVAAIESLRGFVEGRTLESIDRGLRGVLGIDRGRRTAPLGRTREGCHPPGDRGDRQRRLGPVREGRAASRSGSSSSTCRPRQLVRCIPFRYITDALTPDEALEHPPAERSIRRAAREAEMRADGYPAYTTSIRLARLLGRQGPTPLPRRRRRRLVPLQAQGRPRPCRRHPPSRGSSGRRSAPTASLMVDANQAWDVDQAIAWMQRAGRVPAVVDRGADEPG